MLTKTVKCFLFFILFCFYQVVGQQINTSLVSVAPSNDDPCTAIGLPVNATCALSSFTNVAATSTTGVFDPACSFYFGGDVWFSVVVPPSGAIQIQSVAGTMTDGGVAVYTGTCNGTLTEIGCDDDAGPGFMPQLSLTGLTAGTTVFIRFWDYGNFGPGTFQICVIDLCPVNNAPANDLPCNAQAIQLGVYTQGLINVCTNGINEPAGGSCWSSGSINTVWYSLVASTTSIRIRCNPVTLGDPQIALYSGTCGPGLVEIGCNNNGAPCGSFSPYSDLTVSSLTIGQTYYISVDGGLDINGADLYGSFTILVINGVQPLPPILGQDCGSFQPICGQTFNVGNPGFTGVGNVCDFNGTGICLASGERASAWYELNVSANGFLEFDIVPNDWPGFPSTTSTDYDFALWKTAGTGAVNCAAIAANAIPLKCNYSALGVTGCYGTVAGLSPAAYPGFGSAYETRLQVIAGEKYALVVSNFTANSSGFTLSFSGASPLTYGVGPSATVYWSGSIDTDWFKADNWGGCTIPTCSTNAVVGSGFINQPTISGANANCQSITINPGAILSLTATRTLTVCENFTNNGILNAQPGSIIKMNNGNVAQSLNGNMIGTNSFPHLEINKTGSSVILNQNIDLKGNLNIASATSVFNVSNKTVKVAGNFTNVGTYSGSGVGLLEFNGTASQQYNNGDTVPNVRINNTGVGVSLLSNLNVNSLSILTLDSGKVSTNAFEVSIANRTPSALSIGNASSYIEGNLRRFINTTGAYDFPLGETTKGYQRATINFAYPAFATTIDNIVGNFIVHASVPPALAVIDCGINFSNPGLNNGYWSFVANANANVGNFDLTLYNRNYTNAGASNGWTLMSSPTTSWVLANGICVASPVTAVKRIGLTGVRNFATAQSPNTPLPVEWLYFNAQSVGTTIELNWGTASEENNSGFEIYRSTDLYRFENIGWVTGNGTSNVVNTYRFTDKTAVAGINYYYRLKQIDYNGWFKESVIVTARFDVSSLTIRPNPVVEEAIISFYSETKNVRLDIFNPTGEHVKNLMDRVGQSGNQIYVLNPEKLALNPGCYIIRLFADDVVNHLKFCFIK